MGNKYPTCRGNREQQHCNPPSTIHTGSGEYGKIGSHYFRKNRH
jgi:hypothetical protein